MEEVRGELRDRLIPLCFILVESCSASYGKTLRYVLASAATYLDAVVIDSGILEEFLECNLNTRSGKIWYSFGEEDDAQPLLASLPLAVLSAISSASSYVGGTGSSSRSDNASFPATLITIHVHFSSVVGLLEERPCTLFLSSVKNSLYALVGSCSVFYTLSMPEQEALWSEATASPRLLAAVVKEVNRIPTRITICSSPTALAHQKYTSPDTTLQALLDEVGLSESELVVVGGSVVLVDRSSTLLRLWQNFRSNDLFLYIVVVLREGTN